MTNRDLLNSMPDDEFVDWCLTEHPQDIAGVVSLVNICYRSPSSRCSLLQWLNKEAEK